MLVSMFLLFVIGPGQAAGYHNCCQAGLCQGDSDEACYCDARCFEFNDCCSDAHEIGCYEGENSPTAACFSVTLKAFTNRTVTIRGRLLLNLLKKWCIVF